MARRILRWVKAKKQKEISVKDVRRDALGGAPDAEQTLNMLTALANDGMVARDYDQDRRARQTAVDRQSNIILF